MNTHKCDTMPKDKVIAPWGAAGWCVHRDGAYPLLTLIEYCPWCGEALTKISRIVDDSYTVSGAVAGYFDDCIVASNDTNDNKAEDTNDKEDKEE